MSGFQTGLGVFCVRLNPATRKPATALPFVPSTCRVSRSSRRTRTVHEELKCAITPPASLKVA